MSSVPRPLIALLAVAVLFFALWTVALKHTLGGGGGGGSQGTPAYQSAVNQARGLQAVVNSAGAKAGGSPTQSLGNPRDTTPSATTAAAPAPTTQTVHQPAPHSPSSSHPAAGTSTIAGAAATSRPVAKIPPSRPAASGPTGLALVSQALHQHKVLALLFYNPAAADDRAVNTEMSLIPTQGGKVVKLAIPVAQLGRYADLLNQVPVNFSPTLVLINRDDQAQEITGFADSFELMQRVAAALRSAPPQH